MRPGRHCAGRHFEGRKYGILKLGRFWRIGVCTAERIRWKSALRNHTPPQLSVQFVTVHTNVIVVTIRVSIADLIGGGGHADVCPGRQTPSRRHCDVHSEKVNVKADGMCAGPVRVLLPRYARVPRLVRPLRQLATTPCDLVLVH